MSRFFSEKYSSLVPYTPGEQPANIVKLTKLNTNESPFAPSEKALRFAVEHTRSLNLYSDPECLDLRKRLAEILGLTPEELVFCNGSDEILNFIFMAFCDAEHPALFPDISYGFYPVFADINRLPYEEIPLRGDYSLKLSDYEGKKGTVIIANPNAPTGMTVSPAEIEAFLKNDPDRLLVVDEAYVDFGGESVLPLIRSYDNLLVVQTFSKSRSMAGARLGFAAGCPALIRDLNTIRYSTNPYNINSMTLAMGLGILEDEETTRAHCAEIAENRSYTEQALLKRGFTVLPSRANFVFAAHRSIPGAVIYGKLKEKGVLVRHFEKARLSDYNRITIGTRAQMDTLLSALDEILKEEV